MIKKFEEFSKNYQVKSTAGIAVVYDNKILLVHPTNSSWVKPTLGIPKGIVEPGEDLIAAAIREFSEEVGIFLSGSQFDKEIHQIDMYNTLGKHTGVLSYIVYKISDLSEIGLTSLTVPKTQLQQEEVDWAGFIDIKEAYSKVTRNQLIILDRLS